MNRRILCHLLISASLAVPVLSTAATIDIISESYTISGSFGPSSTPYSLGGSSPVTLSSMLSDPAAADTFAFGTLNASGQILSAGAGKGFQAAGSSYTDITFRPSESCFVDVNVSFVQTSGDAQWELNLVDQSTVTLISRGQITHSGSALCSCSCS